MNEPISHGEAKALTAQIRKTGEVRFSRHALQEMEKDDLSEIDIDNVLRGGYVEDPPDFQNGTWRYRICISMIAVVLAFRSTGSLVIVTAWRV